jgi:hypothetical protein
LRARLDELFWCHQVLVRHNGMHLTIPVGVLLTYLGIGLQLAADVRHDLVPRQLSVDLAGLQLPTTEVITCKVK